MGLTAWLKRWFSRREKALSLYRSGMAKANHRDYQGAIADYSAAIRAPHIPTDVKAMALYNRSLAYSMIQEDAKSTEDLMAVLEMPGLPRRIKIEALERRERIRQRDARRADQQTQGQDD